MNILYFITWNYLKIFLDLFIRPKEKEFNQDLLKNLIDTEKAYSRIIQSMPNKISNSYEDLIKIYKKIRRYKMAKFKDFRKIDIRVGEITEAEDFEKARKDAYKLKVDFGEEIGIKDSSAQIKDNYEIDELIGKQVLGVVNFPPKQIADFMSEVLILGIYSKKGVILIKPDEKVEKGDKLG